MQKETTKDDNPKVEPPTLTVDWEVYAQMLDASDMSDAQKQEYIETIWSIVVSFVDLGFGINAVQQVCEQPLILDDLRIHDVVSSRSSPSQTKFNDSADVQSSSASERSPKCLPHLKK